MPILNQIRCDCGCKKILDLDAEPPQAGTEELMQVTDAIGHKFMFVTTACFQQWVASYKCPYKEKPKDSLADMLPGEPN